MENNINARIRSSVTHKMVICFVVKQERFEGVFGAEMVGDSVSLVIGPTVNRRIGITSYVDNSIGVNFTKILNGSLEESKFLYVLGFFAGSW